MGAGTQQFEESVVTDLPGPAMPAECSRDTGTAQFESPQPQMLSAQLAHAISRKTAFAVYMDDAMLLDPALGSDIIFEKIWHSAQAARFAALMARKLGALQEFGSRLNDVARSLHRDIEQTNALLDGGKRLAAEYCAPSSISIQTYASYESQIAPTHLSPHLFGTLRSDLWEYLQDVFYCTRNLLVENLAVVKRLRQRLSLVIACLQKKLSPMRFFCSFRWEKRIWFLRHGSHPAESSLIASGDLFGAACSVPPLA